MKVKNIAIIGGAGFLGNSLSKTLRESSEDFSILDLHNPYDEENFIEFNVESKDTMNLMSNFDCLINLAAVHRDDIRPISRYDDVNVGGAKNICDIARKNDIKKIIFTSSVAIYGFAPENTNESGEANFFNDYGRTKYLAEQVYKDWFNEDPNNRSLIIIRPTVIFGEGNRGNVYNLLKQIASKKFVMCGDGKNIKSMAYVKNVSAFIKHITNYKQGLHIFNYIDKPDMDMNSLISLIRKTLFKKNNVGFRLPASLAVITGNIFDLLSWIINKNLPISRIRIEKFLKTTSFNTSVEKTGFIAPFSLSEGLKRTIRYEFLEDNKDKKEFFTE